MCSMDYMRAFERKLIRHCAPTLAGIKPASIFTCCDAHSMYSPAEFAGLQRAERKHNLADAIGACNAKLAPAGVRVRILAFGSTGPQVLVYRPGDLAELIASGPVSRYLVSCGYDTSSLASCLMRLGRRFAEHAAGGGFPHELGLFLGYPYEDVMGFIGNGGRNYKLLGYWKVYSDVGEARRLFASYRNCTAMCERLFDNGMPLERLAVRQMATAI